MINTNQIKPFSRDPNEEYRIRAMPGRLRPPASERTRGVFLVIIGILVIGGLAFGEVYFYLTRPNISQLQNQIAEQGSKLTTFENNLKSQTSRIDSVEEAQNALAKKEDLGTLETTVNSIKAEQEKLAKKIEDLLVKDQDKDGMPDTWEEKYKLNPYNASDAWRDQDKDELTNLEEYIYGTDPQNPDTDKDGYLDGQEVKAGYDPLGPGKLEKELTEEEKKQDQDKDGMPDVWETKYGLDPKDAKDKDEDLDKDELTNLQEYQYGTDPTNPDTDGDGYKDGAEVKAGYNPKGPGKLEEEKAKEEAKEGETKGEETKEETGTTQETGYGLPIPLLGEE